MTSEGEVGQVMKKIAGIYTLSVVNWNNMHRVNGTAFEKTSNKSNESWNN